MRIKQKIVIIIGSILVIFMSGCYFVPPQKSRLEFTINDYKGVWHSGGFEAVRNRRSIKFYSKASDYIADYLFIWLSEPVTPKVFTENEAVIMFLDSRSGTSDRVIDSVDERTKIRINLTKWSKEPRGLIEGDIEAVLYDKNGKEYLMKGHFKAYQALGTINSYH